MKPGHATHPFDRRCRGAGQHCSGTAIGDERYLAGFGLGPSPPAATNLRVRPPFSLIAHQCAEARATARTPPDRTV